MNTQILSQARQLSVTEQLELLEVLWDGIVMRNAAPDPTAMQKVELDRRFADHLSHPNDVLAWAEVKAAALAHIGQ